MRILLFCNKLPYPARDGGAVALRNMIKGYYEAGVDLTVLALNTLKHYYPPAEIPEDDVLKKVKLHTLSLNTNVTLPGAIWNLFTGKSYHVSRFEHASVKKKLTTLLDQGDFDVVQLEEVYLSTYIPVIRAHSKAMVILRAHNVEHHIWQQVAQQEENPLKKYYLGLQAKRLSTFEHDYITSFDALMPISETDMGTFRSMGFHGSALPLPVGLDLGEYPLEYEKSNPQTVFHIGAMDWLPNQEAVQWFLQSVWPKVVAQVPEAQLALAGRNMNTNSLQADQQGVTVYGEVDNAQEFMQAGGVMVVPLHSGSGMRIKILEGMALGKAIVTTSLGVSGIRVTNGHQVLVADEPEAFADHVIDCLLSPHYQQSLGAEARQTVTSNYDLKALAEQALTFLKKL